MSTTYFQLINGKRRLITLSLICITLLAFLFPFLDVIFHGESVAKVSGLDMFLGKRGFSLMQDMGLDMGLNRHQLANFAISFGYVVMPLVSVIIPVAAMLLAINFLRSNTRGSAVLCVVMMLVSLASFHFTAVKYDGETVTTLRVAKRYVKESADKGNQFVANQTPLLDVSVTPQEKTAMLNKTFDEIGVTQEQKTTLMDQINQLGDTANMEDEQIKALQSDFDKALGAIQMTPEQKTSIQDQMKITPMTTEGKEALKAEIAKNKEQGDLMSSYLTYISTNVYGWEYISSETSMQDKATIVKSAQTEQEHDVLLHFTAAKVLGVKTMDILQILMLLTVISGGIAALGKYKMAK